MQPQTAAPPPYPGATGMPDPSFSASNQIIPYAPPSTQIMPYPVNQPTYPYQTPYAHPSNTMALQPYNPSPAIPAMQAERTVQPYSAYKVQKSEGTRRVNASDKAFGPLLDDMKKALKKNLPS